VLGNAEESQAIDLSSEGHFRVGAANIDCPSREATFGGHSERLQPQNLKVLAALVRSKGKVVTRDQLIDLCWDGRVIGDDVINRAISTLRQFAERAGGFAIETVPRAGYRLVETSSTRWRLMRPSALFALATLLVLTAALGLFLSAGPDSGLYESERTIAVLPLDGNSNQALAGGLSEEIASRLSRNPRIRLLGRNSAQVLGNDPASEIAIAHELRVDFLLSGQVTSQGNRPTIATQLIRTRDGKTVWTAAYPIDTARLISTLETMSNVVSQRIGAGALPAPPIKTPRPDAYQLYVSALGLLGQYDREKVTAAIELLRQASRIDPQYAPIWTELGELTRVQGLQHLTVFDNERWEALSQAYARRGLELAPNSSQANNVMAWTLAEDPRSVPYVERALQLDPNNGDAWDSFAEQAIKAGNFTRWINAENRKVELDPLQFGEVFDVAECNFEMGRVSTAVAQLQRAARFGKPQPYVRHFAQGLVAMKTGQLARAFEEFTLARDSPDAANWANWRRGQVAFALGMLDQARPLVSPINMYPDEFWSLVNEQDPSPASLAISRNSPDYAWNMTERNYHLLRILVNERRYADVASLYDRRFDTPEEFAALPRGHMFFIADAVPVIIALRHVGRSSDADRIEQLALQAVAERYRAGIVPRGYEVLAAQLYAVAGEQQRALDALSRAIDRGWLNRINMGTLTDGTAHSMPDIAHEPAFKPLIGIPRFQELRSRMESVYARERAKIMAQPAASQ
jgi:TolB-like protein/DNA-binding winged helix-turn-helix (wHTH) protein/tetratricopeptide (TPR) repeat protein